MCPQVLQAGASPCIDLFAALTASIAVPDALYALGVSELETTRTSLNSGVLSPMVGVASSHDSLPKFPNSGLSST
jgi:hypothetical protein